MNTQTYDYDGRGFLYNPYLINMDQSYYADSEKYRYYMAITSIIHDLLDECHIKMSNKGYAYIEDSIIAIIDQKNFNIRFKTDVYPFVARKYGIKDISKIEHSIRNAIGTAYSISLKDSLNASELIMHFGRRPRNKEFLLLLTREVYRRLWSESVEFLPF